jgi:hypothetical protein
MKIEKSPKRIEIEKRIIELMHQKNPIEISTILTQEFGEVFEPFDVEYYIKKYISSGNSIVKKVADAADVSFNLGIDNSILEVSRRFSISEINKEFEIIYDRVKKLYELAKIYPDDPSYDRRIVAYLERASILRSVIMKDYMTEIKKNIMLDIGKRIILGAISIFIPYIPDSKKIEAKNKFMSFISHLFSEDFMQEDNKVKEIKEEYGETEKKENNNR